ncbi:MAG: hypothetical protein HY021_08830 [Burkholderiales bacterium]|nr:hypothetical protein [Burkholderiales bacterium]
MSMIHVQIASSVDEATVGGIRWVLIDPSEADRLPPEPLVALAATSSDPAPTDDPRPLGRRTVSAFALVRVVVLAAALAGAWWVSRSLVDSAPAPRTSLASPSTKG